MRQATMSSRSSYSAKSATNPVSRSEIGTTVTNSKSQNSRLRPRTVASSSIYHENEIVCAVSEARGISPTVGLSFVNVSTCEAVLCQFPDTQTFARTCHKISVFGPSEILYTKSAEESKLLSIIRENLEVQKNHIIMTPIDRRYWSESIGHDYLQQLAFPDDLESLKLSIAGNFFAICCFGAALRCIELQLRTTFAPQTLRIKFEPSEGAMMIDLSTIKSLELVQNLNNAKAKDCLFGLINNTLTKMGMRMLKSNILQPSTDKNKVLRRYETVAELSSKEAIFFPVRQALQGMVDTDKVLASLVVVDKRLDFSQMEQSVNRVLMLKSFIESIQPIWQSLTSAKASELLEIRTLCNPENYIEVQELLNYALNEDVTYSTKPVELRNQQVFAIKAGVNSFLDVARQSYKEVSKDVYDMVDELKDEYGIGLILKYDSLRQFYLKIKFIDLENKSLPDVFVNVYRDHGIIECQTMELIKMNQRIKDSHNEVIAMSDQSIQLLIEKVRSKIHPLFKISEGIAMLDMLASFAQLVTTQSYVKPELTSTLAIKSGRHPILEKINRNKFIANDVYSTQQSRFQIITGCNMSGKSTYIRSIALMTIMAQVGCFVPADYASFPLTHQLFARISTDDNIEANISTFASEMREIAFILHNIEPQSLVIVDELGRGTSTTDGLTIAIAISEALIESKALVWFVTHFRDLPRILEGRAGVVNLHLAVDISPDFSRMKMLYKVSDGYEEQKHYGLAIATLMNLPQSLIDNAAEISTALNARNEARKQNAKTLAKSKRRKLLLKLKEQLLQMQESVVDEGILRQHLKRLQEEFIMRMNAIEAEVVAAEPSSGQVTTHSTGSVEDDTVNLIISNSASEKQLKGAKNDTSERVSWSISSPVERSFSKEVNMYGASLLHHGYDKNDPVLLSSKSSQRSTLASTSPTYTTITKDFIDEDFVQETIEGQLNSRQDML